MIRIVNNTGHAGKTKLFDVASGEELSAKLGITRLFIAINGPDEAVKATAEIELMRLDMVAEGVEWLAKHPETGALAPLAALEFSDGTRVELRSDAAPEVTKKPAPRRPARIA